MSQLSHLFRGEVGTSPDNHGRRLLPVVLDELAIAEPDRVILSYAKTKNPAEGFHDLTAGAFARSVNRCAWHLVEQLGYGQDFPTIVYMGPQDAMYAIFLLACVKAGYKSFFTSPRNTLEAHLSLLETTDCHTFARPPVFPLPVVKEILDARPMKVLDIPGLEYWSRDAFEGPDNYDKPFGYEKTYEEARLEPVCILHTSGSTGLPKPVIQRHGTIAAIDAFARSSSMGIEPSFPQTTKGNRVYFPSPMFHAAGLVNVLIGAIFVGSIPVLSHFPPSADHVNAVHVHGNIQETFIAPAVLVDIAKTPEHVENLSRLKRIIYGGGPLPKETGDILATKTIIHTSMGSTECAGFPTQNCPEDWQYLKINPLYGYEHRHVSQDLYELVIVRRPELEPYQGIFATFPDLQEWPMKDLYSPHPTKKDRWLYKGRSDDIIVYATGEKVNPLDMENIITAHPAINAALVNGLGRFQSTLLVEAAKAPQNEKERKELIENIWPVVETANAASPSHAWVLRHMITFANEDKPFLRAGKGTIQRKLTLDLYQKEFDALYEASEADVNGGRRKTNGTNEGGPVQKEYQHKRTTESRTKDIEAILQDIISEATTIKKTELSSEADLFALGLDSLQVTIISRRINEFLSKEGLESTVAPRDIYAHPNMASLLSLVLSLSGDNPSSGAPSLSDTAKMEKLYSQATRELPVSARLPQKHDPNALVVLLTGSTGSLGSYILDTLMSNSRVKHIYCINRGPDSLKRQQAAQAFRGLHDPTSPKITCLEGNMTQPYLGLRRSEYKTLLSEVTDIIHNAWKVNFNLSIESFHDSISSVRRMVDFSAHSVFNAHIFFVSSVSAVASVEGKVPETPFESWDAPYAMGYGQAKFVAERILGAAVREADVQATVCRVGQIAGPTGASGEWPQKEWLPSLMRSSKTIGMIPESLGASNAIAWVPVDAVARIIVELMVGRHAAARDLCPSEVYHIANPALTEWTDVVEDIARLLSPHENILIVPLQDWIKNLYDRLAEGASMKDIPAVKLTKFFDKLLDPENSCILETKKTREASKTLATLPPIQREWLSNWIRQWNFSRASL